jgi:hypothetical protein
MDSPVKDIEVCPEDLLYLLLVEGQKLSGDRIPYQDITIIENADILHLVDHSRRMKWLSDESRGWGA